MIPPTLKKNITFKFPINKKYPDAKGNALELEQNGQLTDHEPQNLNIDAKLPYEDASHVLEEIKALRYVQTELLDLQA